MLKALLVAASTLCVVCGASFALQATVLGRPNHATLELVQTLHQLTEYHRSWASIDVAGRRYTASCRDEWYPHARVAEVYVDQRTVLSDVDDQLLHRGTLATDQFDLVGCPRPLDTWLASQLERHARVELAATRGNSRFFKLRLPEGHPSLALLIGSTSHLPVGLELSGRREHGQSAVTYRPAER